MMSQLNLLIPNTKAMLHEDSRSFAVFVLSITEITLLKSCFPSGFCAPVQWSVPFIVALHTAASVSRHLDLSKEWKHSLVRQVSNFAARWYNLLYLGKESFPLRKRIKVLKSIRLKFHRVQKKQFSLTHSSSAIYCWVG